MRLSRPIATWAMASIQSRGVSPREMPRSNRSISAGISANSGSSASLSSSSRATSASCRSTTTPVRSAASMRARRSASFRRCGSSALAGARPPPDSYVPTYRQISNDGGRRKADRRLAAIRRAAVTSGDSGNACFQSLFRNNAIGPGPAETVLGAAPRPVFGSDVARDSRADRASRAARGSSTRPRPARGATAPRRPAHGRSPGSASRSGAMRSPPTICT